MFRLMAVDKRYRDRCLSMVLFPLFHSVADVFDTAKAQPTPAATINHTSLVISRREVSGAFQAANAATSAATVT